MFLNLHAISKLDLYVQNYRIVHNNHIHFPILFRYKWDYVAGEICAYRHRRLYKVNLYTFLPDFNEVAT